MKRASMKTAKKSGTKPLRRAYKKGLPIRGLPTGYRPMASGLLVPDEASTTVPAGKLRQGLADARKAIDSALQEMVRDFGGDFQVKEIEFTASFNADGKFLGFGVGGAASLKITISPTD